MKTVIREEQIPTAEVWRYDDVVAVRFGEYDSGVEVWRARHLAAFCSPETPAKVNAPKLLLVEVDDPDNPETIDRLRYACSEAWKNR